LRAQGRCGCGSLTEIERFLYWLRFLLGFGCTVRRVLFFGSPRRIRGRSASLSSSAPAGSCCFRTTSTKSAFSPRVMRRRENDGFCSCLAAAAVRRWALVVLVCALATSPRFFFSRSILQFSIQGYYTDTGLDSKASSGCQ
jgi:hypothetical protein